MIRKLLWILLSLAFIAALAVFVLLRLSLVEPGGDHEISGLAYPVEIRFDDRLRPFVEAHSFADALTAEGWLHARYRLWQMELLRRAGNGRLAQALGAGMLATDESLWRAGVPQLAASLEETADDRTLEYVDAYVAGVNAALASYSLRPPELLIAGIDPEPWGRRDVFAVGAIIAFQSANNMSRELLRLDLAATLDEDALSLFLPDEAHQTDFPYIVRTRHRTTAAFSESLDALDLRLFPSASLGSSGWAVSPRRSSTGKVLFAFDSHDALGLPNLFFEVHLFYGAGRSVRGWSLPGLPGVINGFNERIAWGMTNIGDTQDLYIETAHPDHAARFRSDGEWYDARKERISIPVKGRDEPAVIERIVTRNGPLIVDEPPLSLRWTGHRLQGRGVDALLAMNVAENWAQFEAAIDRHGAPSANITYGDRDGRIAFRTIGLLPRRGVGKGLMPLSGEDTGNAWSGYVANADLPALVDPDAGYVAAANARVHSGEPLVSADNAPGYRMRRLHDVLAAKSDFSIEDMQALQLDNFNTQAAQLLPRMLAELGTPADERVRIVLALLDDWASRPENRADSAGALVWEHWYPELAAAVFGARLDYELLERLLAENYVVNAALDRLLRQEADSSWWGGGRKALLEKTLIAAIDRIAESQGDDPNRWRWDRAHSVSFRHELHGVAAPLNNWLSRGPYPWGGGHPVLARARYKYSQPFEGRMGATVRVVAEMATPMDVRAVIAGGQHGHPSSDHYDDQLAEWLAGDLIEIAAAPADVSGPTTRLQPRR